MMSTNFFVYKSLLTMPINVLPLHLKQTFLPIIWIFTEGVGDGIESRLPFKIRSTLTLSQTGGKLCPPHYYVPLAPTPNLKTFLRPCTTSYRTLLCIAIAGPQNQFVIICRHESHCPRTRWKVNISPGFLFISYRIPIVKLKFGWFTG